VLPTLCLFNFVPYGFLVPLHHNPDMDPVCFTFIINYVIVMPDFKVLQISNINSILHTNKAIIYNFKT